MFCMYCISSRRSWSLGNPEESKFSIPILPLPFPILVGISGASNEALMVEVGFTTVFAVLETMGGAIGIGGAIGGGTV